jgi:hypothetical protein
MVVVPVIVPPVEGKPVALARTNASVAIAVVLSPVVWVGAVGVPVSAGEAEGANPPAAMDAFTKASVETSAELSPVD